MRKLLVLAVLAALACAGYAQIITSGDLGDFDPYSSGPISVQQDSETAPILIALTLNPDYLDSLKTSGGRFDAVYGPDVADSLVAKTTGWQRGNASLYGHSTKRIYINSCVDTDWTHRADGRGSMAMMNVDLIPGFDDATIISAEYRDMVVPWAPSQIMARDDTLAFIGITADELSWWYTSYNCTSYLYYKRFVPTAWPQHHGSSQITNYQRWHDYQDGDDALIGPSVIQNMTVGPSTKLSFDVTDYVEWLTTNYYFNFNFVVKAAFASYATAVEMYGPAATSNQAALVISMIPHENTLPDLTPHDIPAMAYNNTDYSTDAWYDGYSPEDIALIASNDFQIIGRELYCPEEYRNFNDLGEAVFALNPEARLLGYINAYGIRYSNDYTIPSYNRLSSPYPKIWKMADEMGGWALMLNGDYEYSWNDLYRLPFMYGSGPAGNYPAFADSYAAAIADSYKDSANSRYRLGCFIDWFQCNYPPSWAFNPDSLDCDQDGIPISSDPDEQEKYQLGNVRFLQSLRSQIEAKCGYDPVIILNGGCLENSDYIPFVDGIYWENFHDQNHWSEADWYENEALGAEVYQGNFVNGCNFVDARDDSAYYRLAAVGALINASSAVCVLDDSGALLRKLAGRLDFDTETFNLGQPTTPMVYAAGAVIDTVRRTFEHGHVKVAFDNTTAYTRWSSFEYIIRDSSDVVWARYGFDADVPPEAVTGLSATAGASDIVVDWDDSTNPAHDHYEVYRGLSSSSLYLLGTSATSDYTDATSATSTLYYYDVKDVNTSGLKSAFAGAVSDSIPGSAPVPWEGHTIISNHASTPDSTELDLHWVTDGILRNGIVDLTDSTSVVTALGYSSGVLVNGGSYNFAVPQSNERVVLMSFGLSDSLAGATIDSAKLWIHTGSSRPYQYVWAIAGEDPVIQEWIDFDTNFNTSFQYRDVSTSGRFSTSLAKYTDEDNIGTKAAVVYTEAPTNGFMTTPFDVTDGIQALVDAGDPISFVLAGQSGGTASWNLYGHNATAQYRPYLEIWASSGGGGGPAGPTGPELISSVTGTIADGDTITVAGTGFGTGATIISFDDFDSGTDGNELATQDPSIGPTWSYLHPSSDTPLPSFSTDFAYSGSNSAKVAWIEPGYAGYSINSFGWAGQGPLQSVYVSYMRYFDLDPVSWTTVGTNVKQLYMYGSLDYGSDSDLQQYMPFMIPAGNSGWATQIQNQPTQIDSWTDGPSFLSSVQDWQRWEAFISYEDPYDADDGFTQTWWDLNEVASTSGRNLSTYDGGNAVNDIRIGHMFHGYNTYNYLRAYFDDVYIATGLARVEIGNAQNFEDCTVRWIQPFTSWSSTSIAVPLNIDGLSSGTYYIFVILSDGTASAGYEITIP